MADNAAADVVRDPPRALISGSWTVIWLLAAPLVVGLAVFAVYPFIDVLALSFSKSSLGRPFQKWPVAANYLALARDETFRAALVRTMIFAIPVPLIEMTLGFSVALLLHSSLRGAGWIRGVILLPLMTPPMMVATAWKLILAPAGGLLDGVLLRTGLLDQPISFLGTMPWAFLSVAIADIWQWTPFVAILSYAALQGLPEDVVEAARVDGASSSNILWHITLPILAPTLLAILLLRVVIAFKLFRPRLRTHFRWPGLRHDRGRLPGLANRARAIRHRPCLGPDDHLRHSGEPRDPAAHLAPSL